MTQADSGDARSRFGFARNRALWTVSVLGSLLLLAPVVAGANWQAMGDALAQAEGPWFFAGAMVLFTLEGVFASLRLGLFADRPQAGRPPARRAFAANALYVLGVAFLPARLGEGVGILVMNRMLGLRAGAAVIAVVAQRLFDLLVLTGMVLPVVVVITGLGAWTTRLAVGETVLLGLAAAAVLLTSALLLRRPGLVLTPAAACGRRHRTGAGRLLRGAIRLALQGRLWARRVYPGISHALAGGVTLAKWCANVGGLFAVLMAAGIEMAPGALLVIGVLYNFLLAVPIPTIGGIGLSEAGLTALLTLAGVPIADAAAASLLVRALLLIVPVVYAGGTWALLAATEGGAR